MKDLDVFLEAPKGVSQEVLAAYLDEACGGDGALRERVEALLAADGGNGLMDSAPLERERGERLAEAGVEGTMIGNYKLLHEIGKGGFGVVYMAEQLRPVKRRVALKIIKLGMDTKQVVARFEAERQALAMMDHPNIARVLDAGATESGRPYFVMDLVRGVPITTFCDENRLAVEERLALFIEVCGAVQHAHQKGVIHRDLKPSNVMVTLHDDKAVPKVIDFGVAKATQTELTELTLYTRYDQFIGTPAYMSPEQAQMSGLDVDTRSDIYSLGVLLYELLTGVTPFDPKELAMSAQEEIRRKIREDEPPKPSTLLSTLGDDALTSLAKRLKVVPEKLRSELRGDLDWIIMKALEKDRKRRYDSATALAADLERHLADEPVTAAAPSAGYRIGKYVRRHRVALATAAVFVGVLFAGLGASLWQGVLLREANAEKDGALATAEAVQKQLEADQVSDRIRLAEESFAAERADLGVAHLTHLLRRDPGNRVAAERLVSALVYRDFPQLVTPILSPVRGVPLGRRGVRWSDDGKRVLAAVLDARTVCRWDAESGEREALVEDTEHRITVGVVSPDERWVVAAVRPSNQMSQAKVGIWASPGGELVREFDHPFCSGLRFDDSGELLASYGSEGVVRIWSTESWSQVGGDMRHEGERFSDINTVDFSSDGRLIATASDAGEAQVWNIETGGREGPAMKHRHYVYGLDFSPDDRYLVTSAVDYSAQVWEVGSGRRVGRTMHHEGKVNMVVFGPGGGVVASASDDGTARLWDAMSGEAIGTPLEHGHAVLRVEFSELGDRIVTVAGGDVRVWSVVTGEQLGETLPGSRFSPKASFCPGDESKLLVVSHGDESGVWETPVKRPRSLVLRHRVAAWQAMWGGRVSAAQFSGDGARIVTSTASDGSKVWDVARGEQLGWIVYDQVGWGVHATFDPADRSGRLLAASARSSRPEWPSGLFLWELDADGKWEQRGGDGFLGDGALRYTEFSRDGSLVLGACSDRPIRVWDARTKELVCAVGPENAVVPHYGFGRSLWAHFSRDGKRLIGSSGEHQVRVWRLPEGIVETPPLLHDGAIDVAEFSPCGTRVVTGSRDMTARIWDAATGDPEGMVMVHSGAVNHAEFSPDGELVVTASNDWTARLWDGRSGEPVGLPMHHQSSVVEATFSPDGTRIATASYDGTARIWDAVTGLPLSEPLRHESWVTAVEFSPDGERMVSCGDDGTARLWDVPSAELPVPDWFLGWAEAVAGKRDGGDGVPAAVAWSEVKRIEEEVRGRSGDGYYDRLVGWYYRGSRERTITPFSTATVDDAIRNEIDSDLTAGRYAAVGMAPDHAGAVLALGWNLVWQKWVDNPGYLWRAGFCARQVLRQQPGHEGAVKLLGMVEEAMESGAEAGAGE